MQGTSAAGHSKAEDFVGLHREPHEVGRCDERGIWCQHLRQDPTGLSTAFSNVKADILVEALVEQVAQRRYAEAEHVC
ncbi:MAG TPA: hypothetical protein VGR34_07315, partial [Candidatus Dormibacteraeota bacterium]|nr:hypothetical protein [Candidatus Dormibacteraeota bacterium]